MIPVTPFRVHHFLVISGPNERPTPYDQQVRNIMTTWVRERALVYLDRAPALLVDQSKASANILGGYVSTNVIQEKYLTCDEMEQSVLV